MSGLQKSEADLFTEALQQSEGDRCAFLEAACNGDDLLRGRVEALLAARAEAAEFLETIPPEVKPPSNLPGEKAGDWIGRYKLLQQIGEGGCGIVFMAEHAEAPRLIREVRGDLDWIAMKALEKDRARRYPTMNRFAADVRRYLAGEPVSAGPPSAIYRFKRSV